MISLKAISGLLLAAVFLFVCSSVKANNCETIDYSGTIYSKVYVTAKMPDGKYLSVPVVNGYLPTINQEYENGRYYRTYSYHKRIRYTPGVMPTYSGGCDTVKASDKPLPPPRVSETVTDREGNVVWDSEWPEWKKREAEKARRGIGITESYGRQPPPMTRAVEDDDPPVRRDVDRERVYKDLQREIAELRRELQKIQEQRQVRPAPKVEKVEETPKVSPLPRVSPLPPQDASEKDKRKPSQMMKD